MADAGTDIVIWGATGFVGKLVAEYMWPRYGETGELRLALGGRRRQALEDLRRDLGAGEELPLVVGDAFDEGFLDEMTKNARLVVSTVGPYAKYGTPLVSACVKNGTDYIDLCGEPQWMHRMIRDQQEGAESSGARIVHACGFDSIPSDMGVFYLQSKARERFGHAMNRVRMRVKAMSGTYSGGTMESMLHQIEEARRDAEAAAILKNPYALAPEGKQSGVRQTSISGAQFDKETGVWLAPFVMAAINTLIVHRSNALRNYPYGRYFKYDEAVMMGKGFKGKWRAMSFSSMLGLFLAAASFGPSRAVMRRMILPKPGQGPSREAREKGFFSLLFSGTDDAGNALRVKVKGNRDPGYGSTSKMLGEAAVCMVKDIPEGGLGGGFWTPSTAMREKLVERLTENAGLHFAVLGKEGEG
jgi:short subunit dehydrogenase-like uncharacterized protein